MLQEELVYLLGLASLAEQAKYSLKLWQDGIPLLFHVMLCYDTDKFMPLLEQVIQQIGIDGLVSLRTKLVFHVCSGFKIPMAGQRTLLHIAIEHGILDVVDFLLQMKFPLIEDENHLLPQHSSMSAEMKEVLQKYGIVIPEDSTKRCVLAMKQMMLKKPSADTFRERFLECYRPYIEASSIPRISEVTTETHGPVVKIRNFLSPDICQTLVELYEQNMSTSNKAPNTMSRQGYSLRGTKLETLGFVLSQALAPYATVIGMPAPVVPEFAHGFFIEYSSGNSTLDLHRDGGLWTASLCLLLNDCSQTLTFVDGDLNEKQIPLEAGSLILHKGCVPHKVDGECVGRRVNLLFWFY